MSDKTKQALISAGNTFIASFIGVLAVSIQSGDIHWTFAFWGAIGVAALRAAVKAVIGQFVPIRLGGAKA